MTNSHENDGTIIVAGNKQMEKEGLEEDGNHLKVEFGFQ